MPDERPWMLDFVDRQWVVDGGYTQQKLGWRPGSGIGILDRLPVILARYAKDRRRWEARNCDRNERRYTYSP